MKTSRALAIFLLVAGACDATFSFDEHSIEGGAADAGADGTVEGSPGGGPCTSDAQCGGLRCDVTISICVACLANDDCKDPKRPFCAKTLEYCVECLSNEVCGPRKRCDTTANRCVDTCREGDEECPSGLSCNEDRELCVECRGNANCADRPNTPFCDTAIGRCVACASSAQCPANKPSCDRRTGTCAECLTSLACGATQVCDPSTLTCRTR
ncbi:MAG: hypothetical protein JST00_42315 [Deltaproteobacteria bacterium]|nr:hypothetical protein [Deltaproteobacteria bacterium]